MDETSIDPQAEATLPAGATMAPGNTDKKAEAERYREAVENHPSQSPFAAVLDEMVATEINSDPAVPEDSRTPEQSSNHTDITVVFGQGPIKPVLLSGELSDSQKAEWSSFKSDPLHTKEPEFRVVEGVYAQRFKEIDERPDLSQARKDELKEGIRAELQHNPRLALHRYGRFVSLASGSALVDGLTDKLILSGGKTMPGWAQSELTKSQRDSWPSEGELMKALIIRRFGDAYQKKYDKPIEDALFVEDMSPTTIHNFAHVLEKYKTTLDNANGIGFLSTDAHIPRVIALANVLMDQDSAKTAMNSRDILTDRAQKYAAETKSALFKNMYGYYEDMVDYASDPAANPIAQAKADKEARLLAELSDPKALAVWEINGKIKPELHDVIVRIVNPDLNWVARAKPIFESAGIEFDNLTPEFLEELKISDPEKYNLLHEQLGALNAEYSSQYSQGTVTPATKKDV